MNRTYDLEERAASFSKELITFLKACPKNELTKPLINQCLRSGTSIGANYMEANGAASRKDFGNKIFICKKEGKETMYWLELIGMTIRNDLLKEKCRKLWQEAKELTLIFSKIGASTKNRLKNLDSKN